jgi:alkylation response protein AidB-like acyl-CoA dehydrogenase
MDFNFTEEQTMLRDTLSRNLADTYNFDARQKVVHGGKGWNPAVWQAFAEELGILGAPFAEAHGGLGGGVVENMVVMEEIPVTEILDCLVIICSLTIPILISLLLGIWQMVVLYQQICVSCNLQELFH